MAGFQTRTRQLLAEQDPTVKDGIKPTSVQIATRDSVEKFDEIAKTLKLPKWVVSTASFFFHRFYSVRSMKRNERALVCSACLFLACKVEECFRDLESVVRHCYVKFAKDPEVPAKIADPQRYPMFLDTVKRNVLTAERALLMAIGFDLNVIQPHNVLNNLVKQLNAVPRPDGDPKLKTILQMAVNFVNDQFRTNLCLQYSLVTIAKGAYFQAVRFHNFDVPLPTGQSLAEFLKEKPEDLEGTHAARHCIPCCHAS